MKTHCKHGHEFIEGSSCKACDAFRQRKWKSLHPDKVKAWRLANREKINQRNRDRRRSLSVPQLQEQRSANASRMREWYRNHNQLLLKAKLCAWCNVRKISRQSKMCPSCYGIKTALGMEGLQHATLKGSYECLKNSKRKLTELQQQLSQTGKLEIATALALLREVASALPDQC